MLDLGPIERSSLALAEAENRFKQYIEKSTLQNYLAESASSLMKSLDETSVLLNEKNESDLPIKNCNLMQCRNRVYQLLYNDIRKINADLNFHFDEVFTVPFYPAYLDSVVFNLISNSLRYHDSKKQTRIDVRCKGEEKYFVLEVQDNGLGIDLNKYGDRIFKLKQSSHNHPESTGIGLYMIRAQLESLGGEIQVESEPNIGSAFRAFIPKNR